MALDNHQLVCMTILISIILWTESTNAQLPGEGVILSPPVTQVVTSGENVVFNCYARGNRVEWIINGSVVTSPYTSYISKGFTFSRVHYPAADPNREELDRWNLTINVLASTALNNNTRIQCSAFGSIQGQSDNVLAHLIIASPPNTPDVQIQTSTSGHAFNITWQRPFTHEGYDITHYSLMVENETSGEARNFIIPPNNDNLQQLIQRETDEVSYNFCDELVFTLKAHNTLGESEAATFILAFPIVPQEVNEAQISTTPRIDVGGSLHLDINFQAPNICSFQIANYTIVILHNGQVAVRMNPRTYRATETSQRVEITQGLERNRNYTLQITVITEFGQTLPAYHHFSTKFTLVSDREDRQNVEEEEFTTKTDTVTTKSTTQMNADGEVNQRFIVITSAVSIGMSALIFIIVIGLIVLQVIVLMYLHRQRKRNKPSGDSPNHGLPRPWPVKENPFHDPYYDIPDLDGIGLPPSSSPKLQPPESEPKVKKNIDTQNH